jgi:hypothetical protein
MAIAANGSTCNSQAPAAAAAQQIQMQQTTTKWISPQPPITTQYNNLSSTAPPVPLHTHDASGNMLGSPIMTTVPSSPALAQGRAYVQYAPAINPADYIRKDSIPCYACTL